MSRPKLLVVEDEAMVAMIMELQLRRRGFDVTAVVATGEEAITHVERQAPDVVLMDVHLAGKLSGIEAARQLFERHGTPIIIVSAYPEAELSPLLAGFRPFGFLEKPVDASRVEELILSLPKAHASPVSG